MIDVSFLPCIKGNPPPEDLCSAQQTKSKNEGHTIDTEYKLIWVMKKRQ